MADVKALMKEKIKVLDEASKAYYARGEEIMSNFEYDKIYDELVELERQSGIILAGSPTQRVGYEILSELPKEVHPSRMLSLDKTKSREELKDWLGEHQGILSWKLDGLTIVLTYEDGKLLIMDNLDFTKHFEKHRNPDNKSFVAVAHIDGNSMGKNIQAFIGNLDQDPDSTVATSLCQMKLLSQEIDNLYKEALVKTVKEVYEDQGKEVAFRPVIRDGDDITFIIEAKKAFEFVKTYMTKLSEEIKDEKAYPIMTGSGMKVSAGAGITFVHDKFPFDVAYDYAEQLCKSAKTKLKELSGDEKIPESTSCLDFQVIRSGMGDNIAEYREKRYRFRDNKDDGDIYSLEKRPYFFVDKGTAISGVYADFENLFAFVGESVENKNLARNKLKMLRNAYSEGVQAANDCYALIKSRDKGGVAGDDRTAFNENKVAEFFDVLDVMDFV